MFTFALFAACVTVEVEETPIREEGPFSRVEIDTRHGDVELVGVPDRTAADGLFRTRFSRTPPELESFVDGDVLHLIARCDDLQLACSADVIVEVPEGVSVDVINGSGDVRVSGTVGDVVASTGSGDVHLAGLSGTLVGETGSGDVLFESVLGDLDGTSGSGDIVGLDLSADHIHFATLSGDVDVNQFCAFARIDASSGSGDIRVGVPDGTYALDLSSGSGDVDVTATGITGDPAAESVIRAETGSGDILVTGM